MAHHDSTPQAVLDAPTLRPDPVWVTHETRPVKVGDEVVGFHTRSHRPAFVGNVERDLLGSDRPDRIARRRKARAAANRVAQRSLMTATIVADASAVTHALSTLRKA